MLKIACFCEVCNAPIYAPEIAATVEEAKAYPTCDCRPLLQKRCRLEVKIAEAEITKTLAEAEAIKNRKEYETP